MLGWILLAVVVLGAAAFFVVQLQSGRLGGQFAAGTFAGGGIVLVAFFALPWVSFDGGLDMLGGLISQFIPSELVRQVENTGLLQELRRLISQQTFISGWSLAAEVPTMSALLQFTLFTVPAVGVSALISGAFALMDNPMARPAGLFLVVLSVVSAGLLFFVMRSIRTLGIDPGLLSPFLDMLGIRFGPGLWFAFGGIALCGVCGLLLAQMPPTRSPAGPGRRFRPSSRRSSSR